MTGRAPGARAPAAPQPGEMPPGEAPGRPAAVAFAPGAPAVTAPDRETALALVRARLAEGRGFALATLNLDHLVKLRRDPAFAAAYAHHDIVTADGNPVVLLSRLAGRPVRLVPGSDLVADLAREAAAAGAGLALVGATDAVLAAAAARLEAEAPGLRVVARIAPSHPFDPGGPEADAVIARLRAADARLVLLALGAPRQEVFAARAAAALPATGFASVGAGLDFLAGSQTRAPRWVRRIAMEWAWRVAHDPRRLARRYLDCALILPGLAIRAVLSRRPTT